jgi:sugar/nucleoside kinase (ribokinase family)
MSCDIYAVGHALVDIQAHVTDQFLEQLEYAKGLMTLVSEEAQREVLEQLRDVPRYCSAGGSAANTVVGVAQFGGRGSFAGKVGDDDLGRFFLEDLRKLHIRSELPPTPGGTTGTCVVLITADAQRTMLTNLALSSTLGPEDISEAEIAGARYVYVEGYLFAGEPTRAAAYRAIELAQRHGVKVALTVSDPFLIQYHRDEFWKLIEGPVDLLFCNLEESRALTGHHDPIECARDIHRHAENVVLTMGADGSLLMHNGEVIPIEAVPVDAVDTTGAGDIYAAGILYGITNGLTWRQAGRLASHAAARVVGQFGARLRVPLTAEERRQVIGSG